jgi:hypothetical protein
MDAFFEGIPAVALADTGSQADVISPELAHKMGRQIRRLLAPVVADLGAEGHEVRLALFTNAEFTSGSTSLCLRPYFVAPLPPGIDAILGLPWFEATGAAASSTSIFLRPSGPSEPIVNLTAKRFATQPDRNFLDLGFTKRKMTPEEEHSFVICAMLSGSSELDEFIDFEPFNPLLGENDDDPSLVDLTEEDCTRQLNELLDEFSDILVTELPPNQRAPFRPVNHSIPLIDPNEHIRPKVIPIPDKYRDQFAAHTNKFVESGWWQPQALQSACALFAVPKADRTKARFVINLKPRNANTRKMHTPLPDMRAVRNLIASFPYRSKLDFKNAYEQIRVETADVPNTGMATPLGTFVSLVMQQGDCNAPETMHRVCYMMFRRCIGRFLDGFYDDWFVYSRTRRAHLRYLRIVFTTLRWYRFLLSREKLSCFAPSMEILGAVVADDGISVIPERWDTIRSWPKPRNPKDVQRFMGTINWMSDHVPRLSEIAAPITRLTGKVQWNWTPSCDLAFDTLKDLVPQKLSPLNWSLVDSGAERVFLFTDASIFGCGGWLGQGPTRELARPFRFFSAKFNPAQKNYHTTDQELLAVLASVLKFREHLIGRRFTVVSDHMPLRTYWTQPPKQTRRHVRMWETLSGFDFDWEFTSGRSNAIADSLSRLAELSLEEQEEPIDIDAQADDDLELAESIPLPASLSVAALVNALVVSPTSILVSSLVAPLAFGLPLAEPEAELPPPHKRDTMLTQLPSAFRDPLPPAYAADSLFAPVVKSLAEGHLDEYPAFRLVDGVLFIEDSGGWRLVVPKGRTTDGDDPASAPTFREALISFAHESLGHLGPAKTLSYLRRWFYWPHAHKDVFDYCRSCEPCARGKAPTAAPFGLLHPLEIAPRPWAWVSMDFVVGLPPVPYRGDVVDSCLTVTDMLGKMVHVFPVPSTATALQIADVFRDGVYRLHGLPEAIVSDRDPKFTSKMWSALFRRKFGTNLKLSTSAHPETDGASEATNKTVGTILRIFAEDNPDDWASRTADVEFAINSSTSTATGLSPFEVSYGYLPTVWPTTSWESTNDATAEGYAERARLNWLRATDAIIASRVAMVTSANKHRRRDHHSFVVGHKAYLSTKDLQFPEATSRKFVPKFIGPYPITAAFPATSNYELDLPPHFKIHRRFHASKLRPHLPNDDLRFPSRALSNPPPELDAQDGNAAEYLVEKIVDHKLVGKARSFRVRWLGYSSAEDSWIKEDELRKTASESVDDYLALVQARAQALALAAPLAKKAPGRR